jgi:predicted phage tail protein
MSTFQAPPIGKVISDEQGRVQNQWGNWFQKVANALGIQASGFSGTITTAPLTGGGTTGSMTFTNGILTSQTPAT